MIRLVVNADDLGRTSGINRGVFRAHREGIVSSATLMVAYPAAREAAARLAEHPRLGVGLHVALTGGPPVLPPERLPSLVGPDGLLARGPEQLGDPDPAEVLAEVEAQLARFRELTGRLPTHLDSHHHSHRLPVVLAALLTLARRHRLPVRRASPAVAAALAREGVATTDTFEESFYDEGATLENLLRILEGLPPGTHELMCHPAEVDRELRRSSTYSHPRERELQILTSPAAREALRRRRIRPITFSLL